MNMSFKIFFIIILAKIPLSFGMELPKFDGETQKRLQDNLDQTIRAGQSLESVKNYEIVKIYERFAEELRETDLNTLLSDESHKEVVEFSRHMLADIVENPEFKEKLKLMQQKIAELQRARNVLKKTTDWIIAQQFQKETQMRYPVELRKQRKKSFLAENPHIEQNDAGHVKAHSLVKAACYQKAKDEIFKTLV